MNFKKTALHIVLKCPVARKHSAKRSEANKAEVSATGGGEAPKVGYGKTGVALRYHTHDEYQQLSPEKQDELREW